MVNHRHERGNIHIDGEVSRKDAVMDFSQRREEGFTQWRNDAETQMVKIVSRKDAKGKKISRKGAKTLRVKRL